VFLANTALKPLINVILLYSMQLNLPFCMIDGGRIDVSGIAIFVLS